MSYQISRNGQLYGPYTTEDLHRYIASGHILRSDMVKSEAMPEWITVAALLASQTPTPPPPSSAYAGYNTPAPGRAVSPDTFPDPPDLPWLLALFIGIFTGGLFFLAWDLVIASWARRVEPRSQALLFYIAAAVAVVLNAGASYGVFVAAVQHQTIHGSSIGSLIGLISWVLRLVARFSLRNTLEAHFNGPEPLGLRLSGIMTFFFGGLYFQYKLNHVNELKRSLRSGLPSF